ncbi:hypothetical protein BpHYR1_031942 [Brachionus plicatilis]|uniref:Uncharacterized protein n=1 Tax=Brachionus plicatilis TaxID=10195 RepID=A0A3M7T6W8_BRAPC|nr:hypothetical protein BpHYR1_031942 [Brachionus plicatilis]
MDTSNKEIRLILRLIQKGADGSAWEAVSLNRSIRQKKILRIKNFESNASNIYIALCMSFDSKQMYHLN